MRTRATILILALLVTPAATVMAQPDTPPPPKPVGTFDLGYRGSDVTGDAARFQRYRDIRAQGAGFNFAVSRDASTWTGKASGRNVGYRDQRFDGMLARGRLTMTFSWIQTPLFYGDTTSTAYVQSAPGVFTLDPAARLAVQNGTAIGIPQTPVQAQSASIYRGLSSQFDLRSRRDRALFTLAYAATRELGINVEIDTAGRTGAQPWGGGFGFAALPEVPVPLDNRTTNVLAGAEWANPRGMLRVGYQGSYFNNRIETLAWDNPVRATDYKENPGTVTGYDPTGFITGYGAAQGRMALAPSNHSNGINAQGLWKLPSRSSVTAAFGVLSMAQDAALIPWTSNAVIANPKVYALFPGLASLDRSTARADARLWNANLGFNTHPGRYFGLTARYRYFSRDDRTPAFDATDYVRLDATPMSGGGVSAPVNLTRNTIDVDATFTPIAYMAVRVGVGRDVLDHARVYSQLADTTLRASVHYTGNTYIAARALYERTNRDGSGLDTRLLTEAGVQPASRYYDDASRTRNRTTLLIDVTPISFVSVNATTFVGRDDYDAADQQFGLLNNDNTGYTVGFAVAPTRGISFGATYGRERYTALQRSRAATATAGPSFGDATRDWNLDTDEKVHTVSVNLDLIRTFRNTDIRAWYDWNDSNQGFVYSGPRIDALASIGQFAPLPAVTNAWQRGTIDGRYFITAAMGVGAGYWYDKYDVTDFQTLDLASGAPRTDAVGTLMLGYGYRPFRANTGFVRIFYSF